MQLAIKQSPNWHNKEQNNIKSVTLGHNEAIGKFFKEEIAWWFYNLNKK